MPLAWEVDSGGGFVESNRAGLEEGRVAVHDGDEGVDGVSQFLKCCGRDDGELVACQVCPMCGAGGCHCLESPSGAANEV